MQIPTWKDVGIPDIAVKSLREMLPTYAMDCLVSQIVFHNTKRLITTYRCDNGHNYVPEKLHEEVCACPICFTKRVRCIQSVKFSSEKKIPYYSRTGNFIASISKQMKSNFELYFKVSADRDIDWEWHNDVYHVAFAGGETGRGELPRIAVARAALLTPYLWDSLYDWKNACYREVSDQKFLTNLINHFAQKKER
jgi:hypothetical protein